MQENREYAAEMLRDLKEYICTANVDRIFIYGAGQVGLLIYFLLKQNNIHPYAFVVTKKTANKAGVDEMPVSEYNQGLFDENDMVIIAALDKAQDEIKEKCRGDFCKKAIITEYFHKRYIEEFRRKIEDILTNERMALYRSGTEERKTIGKYFQDADKNSIAFVNRFVLLTRNLDPLSRDIIAKCVERVRRVNSCSEPELDVFTKEEKKEMEEIHNYFREDVIRVGTDAWMFHGYLLPVNDFSSDVFYSRLGISMIGNLDGIRCKDIMDVGGFIGDSALVLSEITKGTVHVFEPIENNVKMIEETGKLNQLRLAVINRAVSAGEETISFSVDKDNSTCSEKEIGQRLYEGKTDVKTISLDGYVERNNLQIGLIKIHAEGMEQEVIKGAAGIIREQAPVIIVEISHTESDFFDIKPMLENMNPDYKFKVYKPSNGLVCLGMKLIAEVR